MTGVCVCVVFFSFLSLSSFPQVFILSEVANVIFAEPPLRFRSDVRAGKYPKVFSQDRAVLRTITALGLPQVLVVAAERGKGAKGL